MPRMEGIVQNEPEWIIARVGCITASHVADVMAKPKRGTGELARRSDYRTALIVECLTGRATEHYVTPAMEHGLEFEPMAVAAYEMYAGVEAQDGGFWIHDTISRFAASPDRLIGEDGLLEAKCPTTATHIEWMLAGVVPEEHQWQMLAQMACTGREWCDFVSYDDRLPPKMRLFLRRFLRDDERIALMEAEVLSFQEEILSTIARLNGTEDLTVQLVASVEAVRSAG